MSTYILMKILESTPSRYDFGIRMLTRGRLDRTYDHITSHIERGQTVLDLGCGTGALTLRAGQKGAIVKGIDVNTQMLEIAHKRAKEANLTQNIKFFEMGVAELGSEESQSYDVVMAGLCFSELTEDELVYTLKQVQRVLKPQGTLLIVDEVVPRSLSKRIVSWLVRLPLVVITYLITQTTTHAVKDIPEKIEASGLKIASYRLNKLENFLELIAVTSEATAR
jgi:ubiquinone/menaquinone biosynthesis C-methylase UbiE